MWVGCDLTKEEWVVLKYEKVLKKSTVHTKYTVLESRLLNTLYSRLQEFKTTRILSGPFLQIVRLRGPGHSQVQESEPPQVLRHNIGRKTPNTTSVKTLGLDSLRRKSTMTTIFESSL